MATPLVASQFVAPVTHDTPLKRKNSKDTLSPHTGKKRHLEELLTPLEPSTATWTNKNVSINLATRILYKTAIYGSMCLFIRTKVSVESWQKIANLNLDSFQTLGDIEKFALDIINREMKKNQQKKEEVHERLKAALESCANVGLRKSLPAFDALISLK